MFRQELLQVPDQVRGWRVIDYQFFPGEQKEAYSGPKRSPGRRG
jgi:hypothetical protein